MSNAAKLQIVKFIGHLAAMESPCAQKFSPAKSGEESPFRFNKTG
jgi:hypothetical protein